MQILAAYSSILGGISAVSLRVKGGIWIGAVGQNDVRPNILLELIGQGNDYTHQGATALYDAGIRVTCRGDTDQAAGLLGEAVVDALQDYIGTSQGCAIQLTEHMNAMSGYDDAVKVFMHVSEYTSFFRKV